MQYHRALSHGHFRGAAWDYFAVKLPFSNGRTTGLEPQFPMPKQVSGLFLRTFYSVPVVRYTGEI